MYTMEGVNISRVYLVNLLEEILGTNFLKDINEFRVNTFFQLSS